MPNVYFESEQKPIVGDLITENGKDSPCLVTKVYGWRFERVKIGPKAKKFKPTVASWKQPASNFTFIQHQDDVGWPFEYYSMKPNSAMIGDIFMDKGADWVYYMAIEVDEQKVMLVEMGEEANVIKHSDLSTVYFIINQGAISIPNYTKDALEIFFKDLHYPQVGDIYTDGYNSAYQIVEMPVDSKPFVLLSAMKPNTYTSNHDWPLWAYKDIAALGFFEKATFISSHDDVSHAPNIGDIYMWGKDENDSHNAQYMLVTDIADKYMAPSLLYIDEHWNDQYIKDGGLGSTWDSVEQFINHEMGDHSWQFIENQDKIAGGLVFPLPTIEAHEKYGLDPVTKEQVKLGALLAYVPNAQAYHDCLVVTTGDSGFSVWWLAFSGEKGELEEGFKQTFKFSQHLPLFLYNGHQNDYKGTIVSPNTAPVGFEANKGTMTSIGSHPLKPTVEIGQIIDFQTKSGITTTCLVVDMSENHFKIVLLDQEYIHESDIQYSFIDYFGQKEWTYVQHQNDTDYDVLLAATQTGYEALSTDVPGKVKGIINHKTVDKIPSMPTLMKGAILNYYPYTDMKVTDKQASMFWTCLVIKVDDVEIGFIALDKGSGKGLNDYSEYFFSKKLYADSDKLKYVMHMNDTALLSDADEKIYDDLLYKLENAGVDVHYA